MLLNVKDFMFSYDYSQEFASIAKIFNELSFHILVHSLF